MTDRCVKLGSREFWENVRYLKETEAVVALGIRGKNRTLVFYARNYDIPVKLMLVCADVNKVREVLERNNILVAGVGPEEDFQVSYEEKMYVVKCRSHSPECL